MVSFLLVPFVAFGADPDRDFGEAVGEVVGEVVGDADESFLPAEVFGVLGDESSDLAEVATPGAVAVLFLVDLAADLTFVMAGAGSVPAVSATAAVTATFDTGAFDTDAADAAIGATGTVFDCAALGAMAAVSAAANCDAILLMFAIARPMLEVKVLARLAMAVAIPETISCTTLTAAATGLGGSALAGGSTGSVGSSVGWALSQASTTASACLGV